MSIDTIKKEIIRFPNDQQSVLVFAAPQSKPEEIIKELELKEYKAVILILGGANSIEEKLKPRLTQLFDRGIARAAAEANAVIVDGGTQSGVMSLMGEGVASRGHKSPLIGVVPANLVSYPGSKSPTGTPLEPNHSNFVLVEGSSWSSKTEKMFAIVKSLSANSFHTDSKNGSSAAPPANAGTPLPRLTILAGGGQTTKKEVLHAVRQKLPLIVFEGSGGMADEVVEAWKKRDSLRDDPLMCEIIEEGELHFHSLNHSVKGIERLIIRELGIDNVLMQSWETFADYDANANRQQKNFDWLQLGIIILGVVGTGLAIIQQLFAQRNANGLLFPWNLLHHVLILIPILLTVFITAANRFKQGTKWLLLRAGAEAIKREIYRYRTRAMYYKDNPEQQLSKRVEDITLRTMRTEVNQSSLKPYDKQKGFPPYIYASNGGDDGFSSLTPDRYVDVRLGDQLNYFKRSALKLEKQLKALYWLTFLIGGVGTYLAAIDLQIWIALTTSIVAAFGTYLGYRQTENTLTKYNQAATDLMNVKSWWIALSAEEQAQQVNIDSLVEHTEQVLQSELDGWIQQMQNALAELRKGQEAPVEREEKKEPREPVITHNGTEHSNGSTTEKKQPEEIVDETRDPALILDGEKNDKEELAALNNESVPIDNTSDRDDRDNTHSESPEGAPESAEEKAESSLNESMEKRL